MSGSYLTCDAEILDWSWRAVRSEDETLAGAPRWSRMLTFLSLSAREIARGDVLPKSKKKNKKNKKIKCDRDIQENNTKMSLLCY